MLQKKNHRWESRHKTANTFVGKASVHRFKVVFDSSDNAGNSGLAKRIDRIERIETYGGMALDPPKVIGLFAFTITTSPI